MLEKKKELDPDTCQDIVVDETPKPGKFRGPDQLLKDLGIIGDIEAEVHKAGIIKKLDGIGFAIEATDISSGPAINVGDCTASVLAHAK